MESSNKSLNQQQQATDGSTPSPAPDTTPGTSSAKYDQLVSDTISALAAVRAALPPLPEGIVALTNRRQRAVTRDFLGSAVTAVTSSPELRAVTQLDPAEGQDLLALLDAGSRLVKEFEVTVQYVRLVLNATKTQFSANAREAYKAAQGMSKTVKGSSLAVHVEAMKRDGRFGGGSRKGKEGGDQKTVMI